MYIIINDYIIIINNLVTWNKFRLHFKLKYVYPRPKLKPALSIYIFVIPTLHGGILCTWLGLSDTQLAVRVDRLC